MSRRHHVPTQHTLDRVEDAAWIAKWGGTLDEAARRTHTTPDTLRTILNRHDKGTLARLDRNRMGWDDYHAPRPADRKHELRRTA